MSDRLLLGAAEVGAHLNGVTQETVMEYWRLGILPFKVFQGKRYMTKRMIEEYVEKLPVFRNEKPQRRRQPKAAQGRKVGIPTERPVVLRLDTRGS